MTLCLLEVRMKEPAAFFAANALGLRTRHFYLTQIVAAAGVTLILAGAYAAAFRAAAVARLRWLSRLLAPLVVAPMVPPLLTYGYVDNVQAAIILAAFVVCLERLLRVSLGAWAVRHELTGPALLRRAGALLAAARARAARATARWRPHLPLVSVTVAMAAFTIAMATWTLWNHRRFGTFGYDLGQFDNLFYSALRGRPMRVAPLNLTENWTELRNHAHFGLYTLLPFYALRPGAEMLLALQAIVVGLGALPLFFFARRRVPAGWAAVLAISYLLYAPLHGAMFYDFHFQPIAAVYVMAAICFVDARRWVPYWIFFAMALSCREDISIGLCILGLMMLFGGYRPRTGAATAAIAAAYFVAMRFGVMRMFGSWWFSDIYKDLYPEGDPTFGGVIKTLLTNPSYAAKTLISGEKLRYFLQIMTPLAFLPLRRAYLLPAMVPGAILTLLTTGYGPTIDIGFQYSANYNAYLFPAAAIALASLGQEQDGVVRRRAAGLTLMTAALMANVIWGAFSPREHIRGGFMNVAFTRPTPADLQKHKDIQDLMTLVPRDARIAISENEMPHVSKQLNVLSLRDGLFDADYLLFGIGAGGAHTDQAIARGEYVEVARRPAVVLMRRVPPAPGQPPGSPP